VPTNISGIFANRDYIIINVTADDTNLANVSIYLYNSTDLVNFSTNGSSPFYVNFSGLSDGLYYYNATANDTLGNSNQTETRNITLDTINPNINFTAPTTSTGSYSQNYISVNVTANDTNPSTIKIYLYNSTGLYQSNISSTSPLFVNFTGLIDGTYYLNATVNDSAGNLNQTETRTIALDTPPSIIIISPLNQTYSSSTTSLDFNVSLNEVGSSCLFSLNNATNVTMTKFNDTYFNYTSSVSSGTYNVIFYCNDTSNKLSSSNVSFTIAAASVTPPSGGGGGGGCSYDWVCTEW